MTVKETKVVGESDVAKVCNEPVPSLFVDGFQGINMSADTVRINLSEDRYDPVTDTVNRHIVTRLIIPRTKFPEFIEKLKTIHDHNEKLITEATSLNAKQ